MEQQLLNTHRNQQMTAAPPFKAKMDAEQFTEIVNSVRKDRNFSLLDAYEIAESIHKNFFHQRRYDDFDVFRQLYYRKNPMRKG